ncbi:uncharacterized protein LOC128986304 [Macrosteles quadrilineatus]|uniref:uncharacterized protein LOC128986304 n=1 Tax=Macrosteles quadrilineatus TaxID=74068 RepID=UPI0023E20CFA|nr:uncharacterized protein LOC128986304 [Macrosteles quadrilineatus]
MPLTLIHCEDPTIETFCHKILNEHQDTMHTTFEEHVADYQKTSLGIGLVVGKIVKVLSYSAELQRYVLLVKEYLPSHQYGKKFKAVVERGLARKLACCFPQTGDRVAFLNPDLISNPAYKSEGAKSQKEQKCLLLCSYDKGALMWFAKKQEMGGKSDEGKCGKNIDNPDKSSQLKASASLQQRKSEILPAGSNAGQCNDGNIQTGFRKLQPQINLKRCNIFYNYTTISVIKQICLRGCPKEKVHLFGVVNKIIKPISTTKTDKYMLVCELMDDSDTNNLFTCYFFTAEITVISEIEVGDILRLHRVKLEKTNEVDGRVFFSHDIVIFKDGWPGIKPITIAKNTMITDDDKKRVINLRKWNEDFRKTPTLISNINKVDLYCINCKVLKEPQRKKNSVTLNVTDGSATNKVLPSVPIQKYKSKKGQSIEHIVTCIFAYDNLEEYAALKVDSYVTLSNVEAVPEKEDNYRLKLTGKSSFKVLKKNSIEASDIECRIEKNIKTFEPNNCKLESVEKINGKENETSVLTRQQNNKLTTSSAKDSVNPVDCNNISASKHNSFLNAKDDSDSGTKSRKQLFTPNYMTDLSDAATDETSELNIEMSKKEHQLAKSCSSNKEESFKLPDNSGHTKDITRKRGLNTSVLREDDDDAETVLNHSLQQNVTDKKKRLRIESLSTEEGNPRGNRDDIDQELEDRGQKVSDWLFHPKNNIDNQDDTAVNELDIEVTKQILGCNHQPEDMSQYIKAPCYRMAGFLLDILPNPLSNPLDLVSGFCHSGCHGMFLYSTIKWLQEETGSIPLCPECAIIEQENELQLMFMMTLMILHPSGSHFEVLVARNHADQFLNCSVADYMKDEVVRRSRVQLLTDYTVKTTYQSAHTPMLEMCVIPLQQSSPILVLVNTILNIPLL